MQSPAQAQRSKIRHHRRYHTEQARQGTAPLWDMLYPVRLPYLQSRSLESLQRFGQRISDIEEIDRNLQHQEITTELSINAMFEHYRKGVTVSIIRYEDTKKIYDAIQAHLFAWMDGAAYGVHVDPKVLTDLVELDEFATRIYDHAKAFFPKGAKNMAVPEMLLQVQDLHMNDIIRRGPAPDPEAPIPDRKPMKDYFIDQLNAIGGWRNVNGETNR